MPSDVTVYHSGNGSCFLSFTSGLSNKIAAVLVQ